MRRSALLGLVLLCSACAPASVIPSAKPGAPARKVGVLVPATGGRCTTVVVGAVVRRVCLPGRMPQPADTAAANTVRTHEPLSRAAAGEGR